MGGSNNTKGNCICVPLTMGPQTGLELLKLMVTR